MDILLKWMPVIVMVINFVILWIGWSMKRIADGALSAVREEMADHEERLIRLEETVKAMPSARDVTNLRGDIASLSADLKALNQEVRGIESFGKTFQRQLEFLNNYLMEKGPK